MKFPESKFEVGQKLWEVRLDLLTDLEKCPFCQQTVFTKRRWKVRPQELEIHGINFVNGQVTYKVWQPCVYTESLPESDIDGAGAYFSDQFEATKSCIRRNAELDSHDKKAPQFDLKLAPSKYEELYKAAFSELGKIAEENDYGNYVYNVFSNDSQDWLDCVVAVLRGLEKIYKPKGADDNGRGEDPRYSGETDDLGSSDRCWDGVTECHGTGCHPDDCDQCRPG